MTITVNPFLAAIAAVAVSTLGLLIYARITAMQSDVQDLADQFFALGPKIDALAAKATAAAAPVDLTPLKTVLASLQERFPDAPADTSGAQSQDSAQSTSAFTPST